MSAGLMFQITLLLIEVILIFIIINDYKKLEIKQKKLDLECQRFTKAKDEILVHIEQAKNSADQTLNTIQQMQNKS